MEVGKCYARYSEFVEPGFVDSLKEFTVLKKFDSGGYLIKNVYGDKIDTRTLSINDDEFYEIPCGEYVLACKEYE